MGRERREGRGEERGIGRGRRRERAWNGEEADREGEVRREEWRERREGI